MNNGLAIIRNRRGGPRHELRKPVVVLSGMKELPDRTRGITGNFGRGGALLYLEAQIDPGALVMAQFDMPTQAGNGSYPVQCYGRVLRVESREGHYATALMFDRVEIAQSK